MKAFFMTQWYGAETYFEKNLNRHSIFVWLFLVL